MTMDNKKKHSFDLVEAVRYAKNVEKRKLSWISEKYDVPMDTLRDWLYRDKRTNA